MKHILLFSLFMLSGLFCCKSPEGDLIYCSYSKSGAAGLGKDYCELVADADSAAKVVVALNVGNRFEDPEVHAEYPVDKAVVDSLAKMLREKEVCRLAGYNLEEAITGGYAYRIYMEYASGEKINARWYGHNVKEEAWSAYHMIERFFAPWRKKAEQEHGRIQRIEAMETLFDRVQKALRSKKSYPELGEELETLRRYMDSGQWKADFEADERGLLPPGLKRGVLSEDGLYNLLSE